MSPAHDVSAAASEPRHGALVCTRSAGVNAARPPLWHLPGHGEPAARPCRTCALTAPHGVAAGHTSGPPNACCSCASCCACCSCWPCACSTCWCPSPTSWCARAACRLTCSSCMPVLTLACTAWHTVSLSSTGTLSEPATSVHVCGAGQQRDRMAAVPEGAERLPCHKHLHADALASRCSWWIALRT